MTYRITPAYGMATMVRIADESGASARVVRTAGACLIDYTTTGALRALVKRLGSVLPRPCNVIVPAADTATLDWLRERLAGRPGPVFRLVGRLSDRAAYLLTLENIA